jgi:ArsR family transcriptional regulator
MLKGARTRVKELGLTNVDVRQGAAGGGESLPIDKASVNVALLALVLAYTPDPPAALREIRRILAPGGILLIIDLQPHAVELFRTELNHAWMGFPQDELFAWLKEAGFKDLRWHPLAAKTARTRTSAAGSDSTPVPDLFALRAQTPV